MNLSKLYFISLSGFYGKVVQQKYSGFIRGPWVAFGDCNAMNRVGWRQQPWTHVICSWAASKLQKAVREERTELQCIINRANPEMTISTVYNKPEVIQTTLWDIWVAKSRWITCCRVALFLISSEQRHGDGLGCCFFFKYHLDKNMFSPELLVSISFSFQYLFCSLVSGAMKEVDRMQSVARLGQIMLCFAYC